MKNQLFRISPDLKITEQLLNLFGIKNMEDNHSFTRENLNDLKTVEKMNEMIDELMKYYIPCKSKKYLSELNEKKMCNDIKTVFKNTQPYINIKRKICQKQKTFVLSSYPPTN